MAEFDEDEIEVGGDDDQVNVVDLERSAEDAPVVKLVNLILIDAIKKGASDIHIEPYEKDFRVRYRIDGVLYEMMKPPLKLKNAITSRLKIMSQLDIAERRLPQDGRIKLKLGKGREMDYRVSVPADAVRREDRAAAPRQGEPAARHDEAGLRGQAARPVQERHQAPLRHVSGHRPHRVGQDHHAVLGAVRAQQVDGEHHAPPKIPWSTTSTASTRCRCTTTSA
jgi:hypothetical protein